MAHFYTYTLERHLPGIMASGMYAGSLSYTAAEYYSADHAGQALGVMPHNIDCVLQFKDDGRFRKFPQPVAATNRFTGGGDQYSHPSRPKPVAVRKINERTWRAL